MIVIVFVSFAFVSMSSEYMISTNVDTPMHNQCLSDSTPPVLNEFETYIIWLDEMDRQRQIELDSVALADVRIPVVPKKVINRRGRNGGPRRLKSMPVVRYNNIKTQTLRRSTRKRKPFAEYDTVHLWDSTQRLRKTCK